MQLRQMPDGTLSVSSSWAMQYKCIEPTICSSSLTGSTIMPGKVSPQVHALHSVAISDLNNHNGLRNYYRNHISGVQKRMDDSVTYFGSTLMALPPNLL